MPYNDTAVPCLVRKTTLLVVILGLLAASWTQASSSTDNLYYMSYSCLKMTVNSTFVLGSSFQASLNQTLLSQFPDKASKFGFSNFTTGVGIDQLYALYYCKGEVDSKTCRDCVQAAAVKVIDVCKFKKEAIIWYEECTLRYANRPIFSIEEEKPFYLHTNNTGIVNAHLLDPHQHTFDTLMDSVIRQAAYGSEAIQGFATKEVNLSSTQTLRGLAQCTPDIAGPKCYRCLKAALIQKDSWANTIIFLPSCLIRYDLYGSIPPVPPRRGQFDTRYLAPIIIGFSILVGFVTCLCKYYGWSENNGQRPTAEPVDDVVERKIISFSYWKVMVMTWGFMKKPTGEGSFGIVYIGKFGKTKVAVKVLKEVNAAATEFENEFEKEMKVCEKVSHGNILPLIGYCKDKRKLCLVYEFMDGQDLKNKLKATTKNALGWTERLSIAIDVAQGLNYLHHGSKSNSMCIIHRDVKPSNILLGTMKMNGGCKQIAKIADFGTCRVFSEATISAINTRNVAGTLRYLPPEYTARRILSKEVDVYSFGVVLLELIYGLDNPNRPSNVGIVEWATQKASNDNLASDLDSKVEQDVAADANNNNHYNDMVIRAANLALKCVIEERRERPSMTDVVDELINCKNQTVIDIASSSRTSQKMELENLPDSSSKGNKGIIIARSSSMPSSKKESSATSTSSVYESPDNSSEITNAITLSV